MGEIYYRAIWGVKKPRVALLSIGEEETKATSSRARPPTRLKQTSAKFRRQHGRPRCFSRQRGRDRLRWLHRQYRAQAQRRIGRAYRRNAEEGHQEQPDFSAGLRSFQARVRHFRKRTDYSEYGGAPLLGVRGITIIGHGRSNPNAIKNAIRVAAELCRSRVNEKIEQELSAAAAAVAARG